MSDSNKARATSSASSSSSSSVSGRRRFHRSSNPPRSSPAAKKSSIVCVVCSLQPGRYRCSHCKVQNYCSAVCYQKHLLLCPIAKNKGSIKEGDSSVSIPTPPLSVSNHLIQNNSIENQNDNKNNDDDDDDDDDGPPVTKSAKDPSSAVGYAAPPSSSASSSSSTSSLSISPSNPSKKELPPNPFLEDPIPFPSESSISADLLKKVSMDNRVIRACANKELKDILEGIDDSSNRERELLRALRTNNDFNEFMEYLLDIVDEEGKEMRAGSRDAIRDERLMDDQ